MKNSMNAFVVLLAMFGFAAGVSAHEFVETDFVDMPDLEPDAPVDGKLGKEIAIAGQQVLVGANQAFDFEGVVFVFDLTADGLLQYRDRLTTDSDTFRFGQQLAADGDHAAVGEGASKLRFYARSDVTWQQTQLLELDDLPDTGNVVIRSLSGDLAMSGDLLAVGNDDARIEPGSGDNIVGAGAVVLYRRGGGGQWLFEAVVTSPTPDADARFGSAVAVSGDTLLVGADGENNAYVYERSGAQWTLARSLESPVEGCCEFGWSVALSGDLAVVGRRGGFAVEDVSNNGSFRAYERNLEGVGQWGLRGEYVSSRADFIDGFSSSLALRGPVLLAGAPGENLAVFFVHRPASGWEEAAVLDVATTAHDFGTANFGAAVTFNGLRAVIGAPRSPDRDADGVGGVDRWGSLHAWTSLTGGGAISGLCGGENPFDTIYCDGFEAGP